MLVLKNEKNRAVSPQGAQAREMNNEFNAVSVTFESTVCGNKKDPSTKTSISSKRRNILVRNFQRLLRRKFAIDDASFVQYYASLQT